MILSIICCCLSVAIVTLGWLGRESLLSQNPCEMTMTSMQKSKVSVTSRILGPRLFKHPSGKQLNRQPVLFIPGHRGNADQVRSMSSPMHNGDGHFQYFALDFEGADTAVHASNALTQAIFVNDALRRILAIYANRAAPGDSAPKVIIAAHSVGGMIARTAVTLDNHPRCAVSAIIMLSCPTQSAAYSPDASMEALYSAVNRAWTQAYFNDSLVCVRARLAEAQAPQELAGEGAGEGAGAGAPVQGSWKCPACAASIRLLSVSGGDIDMFVPTHLTTLDALLPRPRNLTSEAKANPSPQPLRVLGFISDARRAAVAMAASAYTTLAGLGGAAAGSTTNSSSSSSNSSVGDGGDKSVTAEAPATPARTARNGTYGALHAISQQDWDRDVLRYLEPPLLSLRSSQLAATGFPVDHKAILWCRQLVAALSTGMRGLSEAGDAAALDGLMPLLARPGAATPEQVAEWSELIPPVAGFVRRNESSTAWRAAENAELRYMAARLPLGPLQAAAVVLVSQHWVCLAVAWVLVACLVVSTPLRRQLTGFVPPRAVGSPRAAKSPRSEDNELGHGGLDWSLLQWQAHWHVEEALCLAPALLALLNPATTALLSPLSLTAALAAKVALDCYTNPLACAASSSLYAVSARWGCAYCLAIVLRAALLTVVYGVRALLYAASQAGLFALRCTVLSKGARRASKGARRGLQACLDMVGLTERRQGGLYAATHFLAMAALLAALGFATRARFGEAVLPLWSHVLSLLTLTFSASTAFLVLLSLLDPSSDHHATSLALLYLPAVALCYPSARFSYMLLVQPAASFEAALDLFVLFAPERLNTLLCLVGVAVHLALARSAGYSSLAHIVPLEVVCETRRFLLGRATHAAPVVTPGCGSDECLHEDGGRNAVFEEVRRGAGQATVVSPGVVLGATYRVVGCNCMDDKTLKFQSEWCEFCLCRRCGGRNLPRAESTGPGALERLLEVTPDQALLLALLAVAAASVGYAHDRLHRQLYLLGLAAWSFLLRDACVRLGWSLNLGTPLGGRRETAL